MSSFFSYTTFSSLKIRNYRLFFFGQTLSLVGTWMQTIAQSWLVLGLTGSGTAVGLVTALQYVPILLLGPWGGVLADRFPKRRLLFLTQTNAAVMAAIMAVLVATHAVTLWMIYAIVTVTGLGNSIDNPTRRAFIAEMAGRQEIGNAVALYSISQSMSRIIGPAIAGIIIASIGLAPCFAFNAASYLAVLISLVLMRSSELHRLEPAAQVKGELRKGFRYVRETPVLRTVLIMMGIVGMLTYEWQVILPLAAKFTFHGDARSYAALNSAMGIGAVLGGLISAGRQRATLGGYARASLAYGAAVLLVALAPTLPAALGAMFIVGIFSISFNTRGETTLQLESAPAMRSRVMALWSVAFLGTTPIGGPIIGWIGEHLNPRWGLTAAGLAAICAGVIGIVASKKYNSQ